METNKLLESVFYLSPDGNDTRSGRLPEPNGDKTDGPFATFKAAQNAVRALKRAEGGSLRRPVTVFLRGGAYFLNEPLVLEPGDSGTSECPVCYAAYRNEKPVISGGKQITGWQKREVNGKEGWEVTLSEVAEGTWFFRQLWVNGQRRFRARHPKKDYLKVAKANVDDKAPPWEQGQDRFMFYDGDLKMWKGIVDTELMLMSCWRESRLPVVTVNEGEKVVIFGKKSAFQIFPGDLYYLENLDEFLSIPGEWHLDRKTGRLLYLAEPGEEMEKVEVIAPVLDQIIRLEGKPEAEMFVENIVFREIRFAHTEWQLPLEKSGFLQASADVPGSIYGEGVRGCRFEKCSFSHIGTYGIEFSRGCRNNHIVGCKFFDLGAGGVKIGEKIVRERENERTAGNHILDCEIGDGGRMFHSAVGVWVGQSAGNRIFGNHIHDLYYSGISIGWTWGYGPALAGDNVVENNHVHNIGVRSDGDGPILSDMGGIYTLGSQPGTIIRSNIFHDIAGCKYGGFGIYLDEGSSHILVEKNIVYRTTHAGFHLHFGKENIVRNNIFAFGRDEQVTLSRAEGYGHHAFTFEKNIVYWREGIFFRGGFGDRKWIYLTPGIADSKNPVVFKKFVLITKEGGEQSGNIIPVTKLPRPPEIDGNLNDWKGVKPFRIEDPRIPPEDLSADIYLGWDEKCLYLVARVQDDVHRNTFLITDLRWYTEDSIQIAVDPLGDSTEGKYGEDDYEFGFVLTKNGPQACCTAAPSQEEKGIRKDIQLEIKREETFTYYEAALPLKRLNLKPGRKFGFNIVINDGDGKGVGVRFNKNIYFKMGGGPIEMMDGKVSWEEWQRAGWDIESRIADPLFINPGKGDFRLKPDSPAFKIGFQPIQEITVERN